MIRLAAALALLAAPAMATQDGWPALYDVAGVAADDVLNVRSAPSAGAEIVGTLPPDAAGVEVIRPNARETWGLVNTGEGSGWVSLSYMTRQPGQWDGAIPAIAQCFGTEPFWRLVRDGDTLRLDRPDAEGPQLSVAWQDGTPSHRGRFALRASDGMSTVTATLATATCGDGMSDRAYGIETTVVTDGLGGHEVLWGCCSLAR